MVMGLFVGLLPVVTDLVRWEEWITLLRIHRWESGNRRFEGRGFSLKPWFGLIGRFRQVCPPASSSFLPCQFSSPFHEDVFAKDGLPAFHSAIRRDEKKKKRNKQV